MDLDKDLIAIRIEAEKNYIRYDYLSRNQTIYNPGELITNTDIYSQFLASLEALIEPEKQTFADAFVLTIYRRGCSWRDHG
jgi:hypothetical protein